MEYRRLGGTGTRIGEIALGSWLTYGHTVGLEQTRACLEVAFEEGINLVDTADVYALGDCEALLGEALAHFERKDYVLATKVFFPTGDGPNDRGLGRKHVRESIEGSLLRLRTDYVDLYQCHRYDPETPIPELVRTMDDLIRRGLILHWGVSMWPAECIREAIDVARQTGAEGPVTNQPCYSMLEREIETDVLPVCANLGIGQIVYSPLAQGLLTGKYREGRVPPGSRASDERANTFIQRRLTEENFARAERVRRICDEIGRPMAQVALAWCLRHPSLSAVIVGATHPDQVRENARASGLVLDDETLRRIDAALA